MCRNLYSRHGYLVLMRIKCTPHINGATKNERTMVKEGIYQNGCFYNSCRRLCAAHILCMVWSKNDFHFTIFISCNRFNYFHTIERILDVSFCVCVCDGICCCCCCAVLSPSCPCTKQTHQYIYIPWFGKYIPWYGHLIHGIRNDTQHTTKCINVLNKTAHFIAYIFSSRCGHNSTYYIYTYI